MDKLFFSKTVLMSKNSYVPFGPVKWSPESGTHFSSSHDADSTDGHTLAVKGINLEGNLDRTDHSSK